MRNDLGALPVEMREARRWLLHKKKVPFYVNGAPRSGRLDGSDDAERLESFEAALAAFERGGFTGLGFALGPDDEGAFWQGIDLDKLPEHPELESVAAELPGYVETSPSGNGLHAIGRGQSFPPLGSNGSGIEAYCGSRYLTVTGLAVRSAGGPLPDLAGFVKTTLKGRHSAVRGVPRSAPPASPAARPPDDADAVVRDLQSALEVLDPDPYAEWVAVGIALRSHPQGWALWDEWSRRSPKYESDKAERKWHGFEPHEIDYRAIFVRAQDRGWVNPASGLRPTARPAPLSPATDARPGEWGVPEPLVSGEAPDTAPYPVESLPEIIRAAVLEVAGFTQAPLALVAASALTAVSAGVQAYVDVTRANRLHAPTGLYMLTVADSGERKSTVDKLFTQAIREFEEDQERLAAPELQAFTAEHGEWVAVRHGVLDSIRALAKAGKPYTEQKLALAELERTEPVRPRYPQLLIVDATSEALAYRLAKRWPAGAIVSAEGGAVLGAHAMGKDTVMRNLSALNTLWDGGTLRSERRTTESITVEGARLTVGLQVQRATLEAFLEDTGKLARGSGFLARFLLSCPESTQGGRLFKESPGEGPALEAFNKQLTQILRQKAPIDERGALSPQTLPLSPDAKAVWVRFHDEIERALGAGGELCELRDVGAKAADNAARMAALFHVFCGGSGPVAAEAMQGACEVVMWHVFEAQRFYGEMGVAPELREEMELSSWLVAHCRALGVDSLSRREVLQKGPGRLRKLPVLKPVLDRLSALGHVHVVPEGRAFLVLINPALLKRG